MTHPSYHHLHRFLLAGLVTFGLTVAVGLASAASGSAKSPTRAPTLSHFIHQVLAPNNVSLDIVSFDIKLRSLGPVLQAWYHIDLTSSTGT